MKNLPRIIKSICLINFAIACQLVTAQNIEVPLIKWNEQNSIQKLYLHLDREHYFSGQTLWFKAYFMSGFLPSAANSTLFIELLNNQSGVILKKVLPAFGALSYGQMQIPDTLSTGSYQLRAYTPLMLNHNKDYLFSRRVNVYGRERKSTKQLPESRKISLQFFPEGGNFVSGTENKIAFKATDQNGLPMNVTGNIYNEAGTNITTFSNVHDGMGSFIITPETGQRYYAAITSNPSEKIYLPDASSNGVALQLRNKDREIEFTLQTNNKAFTPAYMIGQMQHRIVFKHGFNTSKSVIKGTIPVAGLPSGILHITFFNKDGMPLAERLAFVDNSEYLLPSAFLTHVADGSKRKLNEFSIQLSDSVTGNFSVSVTDADYNAPGLRDQNIISTFLLTSDIPGYVHNPAWYFSEAENTKQALDLVMMTNGWRRFKWSDVVNNSLPLPAHKDQGYISLSGRAKVRGSNKSFADRELMAWIATSDSARTLQMLKTDASGRFKMDSMIFFDKAKVLFSDVMGKKSKFITIELDTDSLYRTYDIPAVNIPYQRHGALPEQLSQKMSSAYFDYSRGEGLMLDNIIVQGNKTRIEQLEEIYMSGLFAGGINARTYDLTREFIPHWNIFEYLQGRVPGLWIERGGSGFMDNYRLYYRQGGMRRQMQIYLDEMLTDASMVSAIPANDIAMVKVFPTLVGAPGGGANGVIAVYTKRGHELNEYMESTGEIVDYNGYSIIKEFYAPDYSRPVEGRYTDYRLTLDWQPEIFISGHNPKIPVRFYNNERTKRFKIVAEGITSDGKLLMAEQIVEP